MGLTLVACFDVLPFYHIESLTKLTNNGPVLFINENNMTMAPVLESSTDVALTRSISRGVILLLVAFGGLGTLQESGALSKNRLESIDVFLCDPVGSCADLGEFNARKDTLVSYVPSWNQVTPWRLMEDLSGGRK